MACHHVRFRQTLRSAVCATVVGLLLVTASQSPARAADLTLLGPFSFRAFLPEVLPQFEKSSGHKVTASYDTLGATTKRLAEGEIVDVAMVSPEQNQELQKQGKLLADSSAEIARVGYTVFVKKGEPKPNVGSIDALRRTLLGAKSIALGDPAAGGGSGIYLAGLMQRLELSAEIKAKVKLFPSGTEVAEAVAKGDAEIGIGVASDAAIVPGLDAVLLPSGAQSYSVYVAGISSRSKQVDAAKALIAFLTSAEIKQALTTRGFEAR